MGKYAKGPNPQVVIIQLSEGQERLIPLDWTDQGPIRPQLAEARLGLKQLLRLRRQVDELLSREGSEAIIASKKASKPRGGNDGGAIQTRYLAEPERTAATASAGGPGSDVTAATECSAGEGGA
ncbi:MAG TPA: hypothetical protein VEC93_12980 [Anaerolineae bacterium]|nr:hypothetical protein [Anaerolineae bacterium]